MEFALLGGIVSLYRMYHGSHGSDISGKPMSLEQIVDFIAEDFAMVDDLRPEIRNQVGLMRTLIQATVNCTQLGSMMGTLPLCGFGASPLRFRASIDKPVFRVYNTHNFICCSSAACFAWNLAENSESGQNPERYRHCMRGGTARDESQSLGLFPEKAVRKAHDTRVRRPA